MPGDGQKAVRVLLPLPLADAYDYALPEGVAAPPGAFVAVPLGTREVTGVVWDGAAELPLARLKPVAGVLDAPPMPEAVRRFVDWVAGYTISPPGAVLRMAMSVPAALDPPAARSGWRLTEAGRLALAGAGARLTPPRARVLAVLAGDAVAPGAPAARDAVPVGRAPGVAMPEARDDGDASPDLQTEGGGDDEPRSAEAPGRAPLPSAMGAAPPRLAMRTALPGTLLAERAGVSPGVLRGAADAGLIAPALLPHAPEFAAPDPDHAARPVLSPDQAGAAAALTARVAARAFSVTLLSGVTGSGKTEVYLDAVAECLRQGRQALVLLPEIALSAQWLDRFRARFGVAPALWHSELGGRLRRVTWRAVAEGEAPVLVGARSALFLPFPDLGLIVVDEEHETAFKQEDGVSYHARDMAVVRARLSEAPVVLTSATPSLETRFNVETGRYAELHLPTRHGAAGLPEVQVVDLRQHMPPRGRFLSPVLVQTAAETLARGEQAMLFLNRRGYAPLTLCRSCGHRLRCPNCTAWLVEHRAQKRLQCHHCGHAEPIPPSCPECGAADSLAAVGPGVERVQEEAAALFPDARVLVMASDTLPGPKAAEAAARAIEAREVDLIIGTQVVAKGWHFPHLTLVGVVDADLGLAGGDLRAAERTVQLLHQVAGRAGRAEAPGRVLLQSFDPAHPVMQALVSGDLDGFMAAESEARRPGHWPPFGRLVGLIVSAETEAAADRAARDLGLAAPRAEGVEVLGPAPAPLALLRGRYRRRLLVKARRDVAVQRLVREWLARVPLPREVRVQVDVDPVGFL